MEKIKPHELKPQYLFTVHIRGPYARKKEGS